MSFDLRALINDELETSAVTDPLVLAEHVAKRVPDEYLRDALAFALRETVRTAITQSRIEVQRGATRAAAGHSTRWADAGALYQALLAQRIEVGGDDREWKFLGDCTRDDLMHAVDFRKDQARALVVSAKRYEAIADLLTTHAKTIVSDLPLDQVAAVFA